MDKSLVGTGGTCMLVVALLQLGGLEVLAKVLTGGTETGACCDGIDRFYITRWKEMDVPYESYLISMPDMQCDQDQVPSCKTFSSYCWGDWSLSVEWASFPHESRIADDILASVVGVNNMWANTCGTKGYTPQMQSTSRHWGCSAGSLSNSSWCWSGNQ